jgi:hypothetical protein
MGITYAVELACDLRSEIGEHRLAELVASNHQLTRRPLVPPCADCRANVLERPVGCFGTVALPLPEVDERWLLGRMPRDLHTTAGYMLHSALGDFGWDGGYAARLRAADRDRLARGEPPEHFESPVAIRGEGELGVDADQLFDMLFGEGHVQATHPLMLCLFFGLIPHDTRPAELAALRTDPSCLAGHLTLPAPTRDLARALRAVATAASLGRQFLIQS